MKVINLEQTTLDMCIKEAQHERIIITCNGKPVALVIGVEGMDEEQVQLASNDRFWALITQRRAQKTISRAELEQKISGRPA